MGLCRMMQFVGPADVPDPRKTQPLRLRAMLFTQIEFLIFFAIVLIAVWRCHQVSTRNAILLLASYYFYAYWDWRFCGLLVISTAVDFWAARFIAAAHSPTQRKLGLAVSLACNLGMLGYFKYCNFFIDSMRDVLEPLGWNVSTLPILLPVGISFFTFQTLSYTIDVYRGRLKPCQRPFDFALYVAFFPQLVAGPIVRASELLPQLATCPGWSRRRCYGGAQQMLRGAIKKVLLADRMGEMVDVVFEGPELYSGLTVWIAVIAYAGQIYYDFSGYSDMAIGAAKMLGYRFPINFRHPYLSRSMSEFWQRWHITLSRWLRDYLYIPLGGNRHGSLRTSINLMATMTLGGLWHGAAWTFVLWGVWHGAALMGQRFSSRLIRKRGHGFAGWLATMAVVLVGWILFRSANLDIAASVFHRMGTLAPGIGWYPPLALLALGLFVAEHLAWRTRLRRCMRLPFDAWYSPIGTTIMVWALVFVCPPRFSSVCILSVLMCATVSDREQQRATESNKALAVGAHTIVVLKELKTLVGGRAQRTLPKHERSRQCRPRRQCRSRRVSQHAQPILRHPSGSKIESAFQSPDALRDLGLMSDMPSACSPFLKYLRHRSSVRHAFGTFPTDVSE